MLTQVEDANASTTSNPHPPPSKATSCCQVLTPVAVQKAVYAVCLIWRLLLPIPIPFITDSCTYIYLHYVYNIYIYIYIIYIYIYVYSIYQVETCPALYTSLRVSLIYALE